MSVMLNQKQLAEWKADQMRGKQIVCPLCKEPLRNFKPQNIVVDHDHERDYIRGLLCRVCNAQEGHVNSVLVRMTKNGSLDKRLDLFKKIIILLSNGPAKPPASSILGYAMKAIGRGVPAPQRKTAALNWLIRLGKYWVYHKVNRTGLLYGRPVDKPKSK